MRSLLHLSGALAALGLAAVSPSVSHAGAADHPPELGRVRWGQDLDAALAASARSSKPVLVLFQEIPGCATCVDFGEGPLSHPLLIEAIETEFEPVAVHNNRPGRDATVLARFGEPAWNNPVMRFVDARGRDVVPRQAELWTTGQVARRLAEALRAAHRPVPPYLELAIEETDLGHQRTATFAMSCYWEGEAKLGALDGVVETSAGWLDGLEVVEVTYDTHALPTGDLVRRAAGLSCASRVWVRNEDQVRDADAAVPGRVARSTERAREASATDRKFHLNRSPLRSLELTPLQATRVNAALAHGEDVDRWLSPRQRERAGALLRAAASPATR